MKKVVVTISQAPSRAISEKMRMAVGLTLEDENAVTLLLIGDGVYALQGTDPEKTGFDVEKHLKTITMMGHSVIASAQSAASRGVEAPGALFDEEIARLVRESDVTL